MDRGNIRLIAPLHNADLMKACTTRFGTPRARVAVVVVRYDTDSYGNPVQTTGDGYRFEILTFGQDKFNSLRHIHNEWSLRNHDVIAHCTEANFQRWDLQAARECLWVASSKAQEIQARATEIHEKHITSFLGKIRSDGDIVALLEGTRAGIVPVSPFGGVNPFLGANAPPVAGAAPQVGSAAPWAPGAAPFADLVAKETQAADPKAAANKDASKGTAQ